MEVILFNDDPAEANEHFYKTTSIKELVSVLALFILATLLQGKNPLEHLKINFYRLHKALYIEEHQKLKSAPNTGAREHAAAATYRICNLSQSPPLKCSPDI